MWANHASFDIDRSIKASRQHLRALAQLDIATAEQESVLEQAGSDVALACIIANERATGRSDFGEIFVHNPL
ncbi:hypothetical protein D3C78_1417700 [compost metagenome]